MDYPGIVVQHPTAIGFSIDFFNTPFPPPLYLGLAADSFLSDKPRGVRQTDPPWVVEDRCQAWVAAPLSEQSPNGCLGYPSPHLARTGRRFERRF